MNKLLLVMRHEIYATLRRPTFVIFTFGLPLVIGLVALVISLANPSAGAAVIPQSKAGQSAAGRQGHEGYVDAVGVIRVLPADVPADWLTRYPTEAAAQAALKAGEITSYYLIRNPADRLLAATALPYWTNAVAAVDQPVLIVAEGLLMYLGETDVKRLTLRLREVFPGCRLIADVFSRMTARSATKHPSLKQIGASIGWGIDDPREVEGWAQGIHLLEEWYFSQDPDLDRLNLGYRLAYKLAGAFNMVRRAHRIVYYQL